MLDRKESLAKKTLKNSSATKDSYNLEDVDIDSFEEGESLTMRRLPWAVWSLSIFIVAVNTLLLLHLTSDIKLFNGYDEGFWWQYVLILVFYLISAVLLFFGKVEVVTIDKVAGLFQRTKWVLFFKWKDQSYSLKSITDVGLYKESVKHEYKNSMHYKVVMYLKNGTDLKVLETMSKNTAMKKATKIKGFIGIEGQVTIKRVSKA